MFKLFTSLISLVIFLQVDSLDVPRLYVLQDLIDFTSQVKDLISNTDFKDSSLTEDNNPLTEITAIIDQISTESEVSEFIDESVDDAISYLSTLYEKFLTYADDLNSFDDETIDEFIEIVTVEAPDHVSGYLEVLGSEEVWENILKQSKEAPDNCGSNYTQQLNMYLLYQQIMITKMKTLVTVYGAYNFKQSSSSSDSADGFDEVESSFVTAVQNYIEQLKEILTNASREVYICDSRTHVPDQDYVEFDGLFSAIVVNEYEVGRRPSCGRYCSEIEVSGTKRCTQDSREQKLCPAHPCQGKIYDCGWIGGDVDVCELNENFRKRYDWVRSYGNDARYGQWSRCDDGKYFEMRHLVFRFSTCTTCFCKCSEEFSTSEAIRTISFLPQMTNIDENKVVSSIQFVSQDNMIQVQIAEAPLLPNGRIDSSQSSWVPLGNLSYVSDEKNASFTLNNDANLEENVDFAFINYNTRTIFLDQVTGGPECVVTGVKFSGVRHEEENENLLKGFQLEIHVTPFDFVTGQLNPSEEKPSEWITVATQPSVPEIYLSERREVIYGRKSYKYDPDVKHTTEVMSNKYLKFDSSSLHSDGGQSTVPFFDARPIDSENSLAFNGVGLVYRKAEEFAGLIAFELFTIDISMVLDSSID